VGSRDGVALLVSCKSRVCGDNYDAGDYREGRNAATTVMDAVEKY
jgi:hypothetical protein